MAGKIADKKEFIQKCINKHGDKYSYENSEYLGVNRPITIYCKKHGFFTKRRAKDHLDGRGCNKCWQDKNKSSGKKGNSGWNKSEYCKVCKTAYFYILHPNKENFIKIGITKNFKNRYQCHNDFPFDYNVNLLVKGECDKIFEIEESIKKKFKKRKEIPITKFVGYTECFNKEILQDIRSLVLSNVGLSCEIQ